MFGFWVMGLGARPVWTLGVRLFGARILGFSCQEWASVLQGLPIEGLGALPSPNRRTG